MRRIMLVVLATVLLVGCGGGAKSERVLHLRTGDYTEAQLRTEFRAKGISASTCKQLEGLDAQDITDIWNLPDTTPWAEAIQTPNHDDDLRQAEILMEECARIY